VEGLEDMRGVEGMMRGVGNAHLASAGAHGASKEFGHARMAHASMGHGALPHAWCPYPCHSQHLCQLAVLCHVSACCAVLCPLMMQTDEMKKRLKNIMRVVAVAIVPFTLQMPAAIFMYWTSSNLWSLLQVGVGCVN
jgi:hypothetical protein